jgi:hypothetical protein
VTWLPRCSCGLPWGRHWIADFLTVTPAGEGEPTFGEELARVRERSPGAARADLTVSLGGPRPARLHRSDPPGRTADLLEWVWTETVLPYWPRRRRIMEADVVARTRELSRGGWAAALADMLPGMRWLGEGRLQINAHDYPPRTIGGLSCCSSRSPRARAGSLGTRPIGTP